MRKCIYRASCCKYIVPSTVAIEVAIVAVVGMAIVVVFVMAIVAAAVGAAAAVVMATEAEGPVLVLEWVFCL